MKQRAPQCKRLFYSTLFPQNGAAFNGDSQIVVLYARKIYSDNPRTETEINKI